jgi:hypothetical protein
MKMTGDMGGEARILFNGVVVVLTTGEQMSEVQNYVDEADVIISVYPHGTKILKEKKR